MKNIQSKIFEYVLNVGMNSLIGIVICVIIYDFKISF